VTIEDLPGLRLAPVLAWLSDHGIDLDTTRPVTADLLPGGRSNVTYRLTDTHGRSIVIRRPPLGHVLPTAHDMAREHRVLAGLGRVGYPAPTALGLCEDESVTGCTFLVMDFVDGRIVATAEQAATLDAGAADAVSGALVAALADLHRVDVTAAGLDGLGRPDGYLPRQLDRWSRQWELTKTRDLDSMDALRRRLADLLAPLPADLPWSLVHGDYRLDNVILAPEAPEVVAVLDWEMSTLGDPLADLALSLVYWTQAADGLRHRVPVAEHLTDGPGFWDRGALVEEYARLSGRTIDHLDACTALACFKLAVITESIHARTLSGKQLGSAAGDAHAMGVATEALADLGLAVVREGTVAGLSC
jgi:aminoglycoside phosphotransferase (APT) family kinase protein